MRDMILVLSFDQAASSAIARKLRAERIYCKIVPRNITLAEVQTQNPAGLILCGPVSGRGEDMQKDLDIRLLETGLPVLVMGSCARTVCERFGGERETAFQSQKAEQIRYADSPLFKDLEPGERWLEHVHQLKVPEGFAPIAWANELIVGFAHQERPVYALQFQVEQNDPDGITILRNFAQGICQCTTWWSTEAFIERAVEDIDRLSGGQTVLCAVSGGMDSAVCAALAAKAVGDRARMLMVDTGMFRQGEVEVTRRLFQEEMGMPIAIVDAREQAANALQGLYRGPEKREALRRVFQEALLSHVQTMGDVSVILKGTIYADRHLSAVNAQSQCMGRFPVVTPIRELFKDEVRRVGEGLGLPAWLLSRQPFPSGGLAQRILGQVTPERLALLREADAIVQQEIEDAGQEKKLYKYFALLSPLPDSESGEVVVIRAVSVTEKNAQPARIAHDVLERMSSHILSQFKGVVVRVLYDMTTSERERVEWQ